MKKTIMTMMLASVLLLCSCEGNVSTASPILPMPASSSSSAQTTTSSAQTTQTTTSIETTWQTKTTSEYMTSPIQMTQQLIPLKATEALIPVQTTETTTAIPTTETTQIEQMTQVPLPIQTTYPTDTAETTYLPETTARPIKVETPIRSENQEIPNGIVLAGFGEFVETPSAFIFFQNGKSAWDGRGYTMNGTAGIGSYSKENGSVSVYCRDLLCDHQMCSQRTFWLDNSHFANGRFYCYDENYEGRTVVRSFCADESGIRFEWDGTDQPELKTGTWQSTFGYGDYLFITVSREDGTRHLLRYDIRNRHMDDLTADTGNYVAIRFAYNGMLYGVTADREDMVKTDLSLHVVTDAEPYVQKAFAAENENGERTRYIREVVNGDCMYGELLTTKANGEKESCIQVLDMKAGEVRYISDETLGCSFRELLFADENYLYFTVEAPVLVGEIALLDEQYYNHSGGKLYRARLDGSEATCIFDDPSMSFDSSLWLYVNGNDLLVWASKPAMIDWDYVTYADGAYLGHLNEEGKIESLEFLELLP